MWPAARQAVGAEPGDRVDVEVDVAEVRVRARETARHVRDVAAVPIVVDHRPESQLVGNDRHVQGGVHAVVRVAVVRPTVARFDVGARRIDVGLVVDVADCAGFGPAAEERSLRTLKHLDAIKVDRVDVDVARRELHGLFVKIDRDVWEVGDRGARLAAPEARAQASHEDFALARAVVPERHVGRVLDEVVERGDVRLLKRLTGEGLQRHRDALDVLGSPLGGHEHEVGGARRALGVRVGVGASGLGAAVGRLGATRRLCDRVCG